MDSLKDLSDRALLERIAHGQTDIKRRLGHMGTVDEQVEAAIAGDEAAIQALAQRVTDAENTLNAHITQLEETIAKKTAEGVDVAHLQEGLTAMKAALDAIQPAPAPGPSGP